MAYKAACVAIAGLSVFLLRRLLRRPTVYCRSQGSLEGKIAVVTGPTSGVGRAAALELSRRRCHVILACRSQPLGDAMAADINRRAVGRATVIPLDLASLHSVRHFVEVLRLHSERFPAVDLLVNNAGVFGPPAAFTEDGVEVHFGVNHLGHFLLTRLLLQRQLLAPGARVITVASSLAARADLGRVDYATPFNAAAGECSPHLLYANSKLANCLFVRELDARHSRAVCAVCVHTDGMVHSGLFRHAVDAWAPPLRPLLRLLAWLLLRSPEEGCQTLVHCAVATEAEVTPGEYYGQCRVQAWPEKAQDSQAAAELWRISSRLCGVGEE